MRKLIAVTAMALALAGCHKKQHVGDLDLSPKVSIAVVNNFTPLDQFTVYMVSRERRAAAARHREPQPDDEVQLPADDGHRQVHARRAVHERTASSRRSSSRS